jgi:YrbI family 3-deoxy-D-manno-octulosonate 8-phosphate phosphatase
MDSLVIGAIDLVCYDFDGVMTDNRVLIDEIGREAVFVNRADGLAVAALRRLGVAQVIISTETNPVVTARARKLGIPVLQGQNNKAEALRTYTTKKNHALERTVYIGNDVNDLDAMRAVGFPIAPADAHSSIAAIAKLITRARGGEGVIREFFDCIEGTKGII